MVIIFISWGWYNAQLCLWHIIKYRRIEKEYFIIDLWILGFKGIE